MTLSDDDFRAVQDYLSATAGLVFDQSRRAGLTAVLVELVHGVGARDVRDYLAHLDRPEGTVDRARLLDAVTVQETQFFRNPPQMDALRRRVLPELMRRAVGRSRPLTIWSAGCSTGEEAYTLSMLLLDLAPAIGHRPAVRIVATDVSEAALRAARLGVYSGRTLDGAPKQVRERWFATGPGGALTVDEEVRRPVELVLHNLVTDRPPFGPGEVDLVVCRNVTIYFARDTTRALIGSFHDVLAEGGYLMLGHSETLWQVSDAFSLLPVGDAFVYRRTHSARRAMRPPGGVPAGSSAAAAARTSGSPVTPAGVPEPRRRVRERRSVRPGVKAAAPSPAAPRDGAGDALAGARAALAGGDYRQAAALAERAVADDPLSSEAYVVLGHAMANLGRDGDALGPLRKSLYLDPAGGDAHFLLAGSLARLGQDGAAGVSYRAAAAALGTAAPARLDAILDGRDLSELVDLCRRLADISGVGSASDGATMATGRSGR